ncbi:MULTISPECIES: glutathione S-transferase [Methylobacterium]|jgi:glutathione S-transferase|uniref:glutathione S-transferase n=1 Tax=Methylobacterium TaxID=407 RepID=UPI0008DEF664|nr:MULTISPECIES: glutathione S-transferase [Methylobacterium]MBZ6416220.1 glutathione S-transferase [Methylobacterium sp.]MBK3399039.1 glutathione S-transferase [Methylobacterium ajmalii]MBK3411511.1 glutathione S-transferase [Methylobacterium ajmalii]MBK3422452.1 glutathione S-transferase [Methylobacterium ajmalii]SFF80140.1 Glutathione S-transferase [Methylobacterium sp. yr596]
MKLFYAKASPFVRKVLVAAHELGLADRIELLPAAAHPINRDATIRAENPLGQVPTLILDDGTALADSRVICEYLDHLGQGGLFPAAGPARWAALTAQSTGDGLLDAALLCVYETRVRQEGERSAGWVTGQREKIGDALARIDAAAGEFGERVDIATITYGCALGYLDLRLPDLGWRERAPAAAAWYARFGERPSMQATRPD